MRLAQSEQTASLTSLSERSVPLNHSGIKLSHV